MRPDRDQAVPPGWTYNPSGWRHRRRVLALAGAGGAIATYLALYQLEVIGSVWEPFFGDGSRVVLHSVVSRMLPVPDAALGALGYLADAVLDTVGGADRWRRRPWVVVLFGLAVGLFAATSILLAVLQPLAFHAGCTLCLGSALISVSIAASARDEVRAARHYLRWAREGGASVATALRGDYA